MCTSNGESSLLYTELDPPFRQMETESSISFTTPKHSLATSVFGVVFAFRACRAKGGCEAGVGYHVRTNTKVALNRKFRDTVECVYGRMGTR